jgi:hypothetical protein
LRSRRVFIAPGGGVFLIANIAVGGGLKTDSSWVSGSRIWATVVRSAVALLHTPLSGPPASRGVTNWPKTSKAPVSLMQRDTALFREMIGLSILPRAG